MVNSTVIIDFQKRGFEGKVFSGRRRGELARDEFDLDSLDKKNVKVQVIVPSSLFSLTSSFFLGMFGPTLRSLDSKSQFQSKYHFEGPATILEEVNQYIDTELRRSVKHS
ncbi:hypothetical protein OYC61_014050 [Alcaligenes nematophilus]|uniref:DUF4325 domain-containing protein n=1 Tax=Alcaligenes nematophilus TaxID=2994643 RepID=A0ABU3MWT7_9BURK|nr:hypothetical protein [Alcaligenes nematophilus]MDT8505423.1 hypothetical protein [Alcaligenes nematophilus]MDT8526046.1 hypothetical protein [Alcaligenes nematophilus]